MVDRLEAYREAGVDLDLSNVASQIAANYCQETWENADGRWKPKSPDGHLAATKVMPLDEIRRYPKVSASGGVDGTGTKPEIYERIKDFSHLGFDLIAMAVDDIPVEGGQAVWVNNALVVSSLTDETIPHIEELFQGLRDAANAADVVLWTGEIAVHGDRLQGPTGFTVDWIGDAFGLVNDKRLITGERVQNNDALYGLAEPDGFRCNGISRVRKTFRRAYGDNWHQEQHEGKSLGEWVSAKSTIYAGLMRTLTGGYRTEITPKADIHGVAHISGGSLPEKVGRMLRATGLGADITDPFDFPEIMRHCQEVTEIQDGDRTRPMTDAEALTTWHGGQGYVLAAPEADHDAIVKAGEEQGIAVKKIGRISQQTGLRVVSRGARQYGEVIDLTAA